MVELSVRDGVAGYAPRVLEGAYEGSCWQKVLWFSLHDHGPTPALSIDLREILAALGKRVLG